MLKQLQKEFLNKEYRLLDLDNEVTETLTSANSIYEYDVKEMLENGYCYQVSQTDSYNFEFEIVEESENNFDIKVKVIDIEEI